MTASKDGDVCLALNRVTLLADVDAVCTHSLKEIQLGIEVLLNLPDILCEDE